MTKPFGCNIKQRTFIDSSPEKVYDTITNAKEWDKFFTTGMTLEPIPGGKCNFTWEDWGPDFYTLEAEGKVVEASRPDRFAFQWYSVGKENPTTITFTLESKHGGTVMSIEESGYPDTAQARKQILDCASGWGEAATLLKFYIEHGVVYTPPKRDM
jgi:uncharacterized protein YndB with AHSA1/START domain